MSTAYDVITLDRELDERIALLRRYRRMLELQRERLQVYMELLDTREAAVKAGDYSGLEEYTAREQQVVKGIVSVQQCIEPLAIMYKSAVPEGSPDVEELRDRLEHLRQKVLERNEESRAILKTHAEELRTQIAGLSFPPRPKSPFSGSEGARMIDIQG